MEKALASPPASYLNIKVRLGERTFKIPVPQYNFVSERFIHTEDEEWNTLEQIFGNRVQTNIVVGTLSPNFFKIVFGYDMRQGLSWQEDEYFVQAGTVVHRADRSAFRLNGENPTSMTIDLWPPGQAPSS